jgi:hypothetical protein
MNEKEKQKTNIQRIAMGLPPIAEQTPPPKRDWLPGVEKRATRRMIKKTARMIAQNADAKKSRRKALLIAIPLAAVLCSFWLVASSMMPAEEKLERKSDSLAPSPTAPSQTGPAPAPTDVKIETTRDGKTFKKQNYKTGNIEVELPIREKDTTPITPPDNPYRFGTRKLPGGMNPDDLRKK